MLNMFVLSLVTYFKYVYLRDRLHGKEQGTLKCELEVQSYFP